MIKYIIGKILNLFMISIAITIMYSNNDVKALTIVVNTENELKTEVENASTGDIVKLSSSFNTNLNDTISLNVNTGSSVTIDGSNLELLVPEVGNKRHFNVNLTNGSQLTFKDLVVTGRAVLNSDGNVNRTLSTKTGGISIGGVERVNFDNVVFQKINHGAGALSIGGASTININNTQFISNAADFAAAIYAESNPKDIIITNSTFINNGGNYNGGYAGGAIRTKNQSGKFHVYNSYFKDNFTYYGASGEGGAIALSFPQSNSEIVIKESYFIENEADKSRFGSYVTGDGGAIAVFDMKSNTKLLIENSTFEKNVAADDGGAILIQGLTNNNGNGAVTDANINNCTFYGNEAFAHGNTASTAQSGGAIQIFKNGYNNAMTINFKSNTFVENKAYVNQNTPNQTQRGGAIAGSGSALLLSIPLSGNIFIDNKIIGVDGQPKNSNYSNVYRATNTSNNIGFDNNSAINPLHTNVNVFGLSKPSLAINSSSVYAGSDTTKKAIPTIIIAPKTQGDVGIADNSNTSNIFTNDQRLFNRSNSTADIGAIEIGWIKYNNNTGTWNLPVHEYDGKIYYEGTSPNDKYQIGYLNESISVLSDSGLTKSGYTFLGWDSNPNATTPTYQVGDSIIVSEEMTLYAIWKVKIDYCSITYNGNNNTGGSAPVDGTQYECGVDNATISDQGTLVKDGYQFIGWNTQADGNGTKYNAGDVITPLNNNLNLFAIWKEVVFDYCSVTYHGNKNTSGSVPVDNIQYECGVDSATIKNYGTLKKSGYKFINWNTKADGSGVSYNVGDVVIPLNSNLDLFAIWEQKSDDKVVVVFNKNADEALDGTITKNTLKKNSSHSIEGKELGNPTRVGYKLVGWCSTKKPCIKTDTTTTLVGSQFKRNTKVIKDTMVYAQWQKTSKKEISNTGQDMTFILLVFVASAMGSIGYLVTRANEK